MSDEKTAPLMKQVPFRVHPNDYLVLKRLMADDGLTFQGLVRTCIDAYMRGDPLMLRMLKGSKEMESVPQEVLDRYTLSQRERAALLEQIEKEEDKGKVG